MKKTSTTKKPKTQKPKPARAGASGPVIPFSQASLDFIKRASKQKREDWLDRNREEYERDLKAPFQAFAENLRRELASLAVGYHFPRHALARLKRSSISQAEYGTPFRDYVSYNATRPSQSRFDKNPNLFFLIYPFDEDGDEVLIAGGLYMPSSRQLRSIREAIAQDARPFEELFASSAFQTQFPDGFSQDRKSTRVPRGFDANHPKIEWLKLQGFFVWRSYKKREYTSKDFVKLVARDCTQILRLNALLELAINGKWNTRAMSEPEVPAGSRPGLLSRIDQLEPVRRKMDF